MIIRYVNRLNGNAQIASSPATFLIYVQAKKITRRKYLQELRSLARKSPNIHIMEIGKSSKFFFSNLSCYYTY